MIIIIGLICIIGIILLALLGNIPHRITIGAILIIILLVSQALLIADTHYHWGTELKVTSSKKTIYPLVSFPESNHILVYRNISQGKEQKQIYVYKNKTQSHKNQMTYSNGITVKLLLKQSQKNALRVKSVSQYRYTNKADQILFAGMINNHQIKKTTISFILPRNWFVISKKDLVKAGKDIKKNAKKTVSKHLKNYLQEHPKEATNKLAIQKEENKLLKKYTKKILVKYSKN
ncbi:DUF4811 domain-containing protein [Oenococcus sp. UCMA 16435]|nr:DUF4811 domain-containing protein [Oenococcus sp. UCMA 16435]MDI4583784.1 DUF4811 domain-containing protein [Oenococcus sp. UCMA 14587]